MLNARATTLLLLTAGLTGLMFALLWSQSGLPVPAPFSPWEPRITLYPSIYALWLPGMYLWFSGLWGYLVWKFPRNRRLRAYWRYDGLTYPAVVVILLVQLQWPALGAPAVWLRGALLALMGVKSALVFRLLYQEAALIRPTALGVIGAGIHALLLPFHYQVFELTFPALLQPQELAHVGILGLKIIGLNVMALEMVRLASLLARSRQSAIFAWFVVTFTFPVLGYPKISHILASLFLIFLLRLIFSRLDTRELMLGLLHGPNMMILLKLGLVLTLIAAAGVIFWSNVKPGLGLHGSRAAHAAILALGDAQGGLLCYTPLYWLALFGMVYVVMFRVWDGVMLLFTGGLAYTGYHFLAYGILDRVFDPSVTMPFLPIFGVFIAIAHTRFGKMRVFRYLLRLGTLATVVLTGLFLLLFPEFHHIQIKFSEIQRVLFRSSGFDLAELLPSAPFRPFSGPTLLWLGGGLLVATLFCAARAKYGHWMLTRMRRRSTPASSAEDTFAPFVVLTCLIIGGIVVASRPPQTDVPLAAPVMLSAHAPETVILLESPVFARRIRLVGSLSEGAALPHGARIAKITVFGQHQHFETFTLRVGKDLADTHFEHPAIRPTIAHGRAALYRSWIAAADDGATFAAHEYYTELVLPRRIAAQKIVLKFVDPDPDDASAPIAVNIGAIRLRD